MNNKLLQKILTITDKQELEELAVQAEKLTRQYFGRAVSLYAPLYISNYCENRCLYCGFNCHEKISRKKLTCDEIEQECAALAKSGVQSVLLLTGEAPNVSTVAYIKQAVLIAKKYFPDLSLEVFPMSEDEYRELAAAGVDGVTVYQETYNRKIYADVHPAGRKRDYDWRYGTPERIASAGIRHISIGALLGLADWREDVRSLFEHLEYLLTEYPGVEYSLSFPRIRKLTDWSYPHEAVSDLDMVKIICAARILFPRVDINLSTRESAAFRDRVLPLGITRLSGGSLTTVGGYAVDDAGTGQFEISDERSLLEIKQMLKDNNFDPVMTAWRRI